MSIAVAMRNFTRILAGSIAGMAIRHRARFLSSRLAFRTSMVAYLENGSEGAQLAATLTAPANIEGLALLQFRR
jgi:hypothetical protein